MRVETQLAIQPKIERGIRLRIQPGVRREVRPHEHLALERRNQVEGNATVEVETKRKTQLPAQATTQRTIGLPLLRKEQRGVLRETHSHVARSLDHAYRRVQCRRAARPFDFASDTDIVLPDERQP
jgi:hypothetical protein